MGGCPEVILKKAAEPTMAALSVENCMSGMKREMGVLAFHFLMVDSSFSRSAVLAETPPAMTMDFGG